MITKTKMKNLKKILELVFAFLLGKKLVEKICSRIKPNKSEVVALTLPKNEFWRTPTFIGSVAFILLVLLNGNLIKQYSYLFKASLLDIKSVEFDGTVLPIAKVPNWVELSESERKMTYDQLPKSKLVSIPAYNVSSFRLGMTWKPNNAKERNAYVTYPVPYMGNYKLDGTEHSGSHLGIDIKAPKGTPVYAIANGVVYKSEYQKSGFGNFITIRHDGVPDPRKSGKKVTLFSNYAHLSTSFVTAGEVIKKGQLIGKVGNTGMATAYHLHFQIDEADSPFHPYWPFSWNEVKKAGLSSYYDGVKYGLGKEKALKYTVNPLIFVKNNTGYVKADNLVANSDPRIISEVLTPPKKTVVVVKKPAIKVVKNDPEKTDNPVYLKNKTKPIVKKIEKVIKKPLIVKSKTSKKLDIAFGMDDRFIPGQETAVSLKINPDQLVATSGIEIGSTLKSRATITPSRLYRKDFDKNGEAKVIVKTDSLSNFRLVAKGDFGEVKSPVMRSQIFTDVSTSDPFAKAIKHLRDTKVVSGYKDGSFRPNDTLNRAEALKIILLVNRIILKETPFEFSDVHSGQWFAKYIGTAVNKKIVRGYKDKTFRPSRDVSRAEFLKMSILAAGFEVDDKRSGAPYADVSADSWSVPFFYFADKYNLITESKGDLIHPNQPITRGEAAEVLYRLGRLRL